MDRIAENPIEMIDDTYKDFMNAVESNDICTVKSMLQSIEQQELILDINTVDEQSRTPLIVAITLKKTGE